MARHPIFELQPTSYKREAELKNFCYVNKARIKFCLHLGLRIGDKLSKTK